MFASFLIANVHKLIKTISHGKGCALGEDPRQALRKKYNYSPKKSDIAMKTMVEMKPRVPYRWKACTPCEQNPSDTAVPRNSDHAIHRVEVPTASYRSIHEESPTEWR